MTTVIYIGLIYSLIVLIRSNDGTVSNSTISFFFTADPQFGWGSSYSGNEERYLLSHKYRSLFTYVIFLLIMYRKYLIWSSNISFFRALQTMIDLGRITALCTDCPQVIPIAGDLTMDGQKRHVYRLAYLASQSYGAKVWMSKKYSVLVVSSISRQASKMIIIANISFLIFNKRS